MTQDDALAILKTGRNVFLTGEPGAGKSYTVNAYVAYLRAHGVSVAVTASTGIAATHIGGMTIHSWSGIGINKTLNRHELAEIVGREKLVKRIRETHVLIIDEISMLDGRMVSLVDTVCQTARNSSAPFGGIQVVAVGDFFQLPPVGRDGDDVMFAFDSRAWREAAFSVCYLSEQHRQEDETFLSILSALRSGSIDADHRSTLRSRHLSSPEEMIKLYSHNVDVDRLNAAALEKLPGQSVTLPMRHQGAKAAVEQLKRGCLSPEKLVLKIGAKVMFTKNNPEKGFVNGTTGVVEFFQKGTNYPVVKVASGRVIVAEPMDWSMIVDGSPVAMVMQVPLRLAWAITVHKSQGMSLDAAFMDLSSAFAFGQGYVALSRVRTLDGLHLGGLNERALEVDPTVLERDAVFRAESLDAETAIANLSAAARTAMHEQFLVACGGSLVAREPRTTLGKSGVSKKRSPDDRWMRTLQLVQTGKSIPDVARELGRTFGTVVDHLQKLKDAGKLPLDTIRHIYSGDAATLAEIHVAIAIFGFTPMKPVYDRFKGKYSYDTLRVANLFYRER